ncbi:MAG TPA: hypothetical protein VE130_06230 [Nitrososphaeraceae archaeon]|nr:hypothetical protein [Nitrososphaeraceae archaeon]
MESILGISAAIVFISLAVPFYFIVKVNYNRKVFISSILLSIVLLSYVLHVLLESVWQNNSEIIRICVIISIAGTLLAYLLFRKKEIPYLSFGGVFGIALFLVLGIWIAAEVIRLFLPSYTIESIYSVSLAMIGFGILLLVRFFWLKNQYPSLTHN